MQPCGSGYTKWAGCSYGRSKPTIGTLYKKPTLNFALHSYNNIDRLSTPASWLPAWSVVPILREVKCLQDEDGVTDGIADRDVVVDVDVAVFIMR